MGVKELSLGYRIIVRKWHITVENKYNGLKDFRILVKSPLYRYKLSIVLIRLGLIVVRYLLDKDLC